MAVEVMSRRNHHQSWAANNFIIAARGGAKMASVAAARGDAGPRARHRLIEEVPINVLARDQ